jgi:hypothetical protein
MIDVLGFFDQDGVRRAVQLLFAAVVFLWAIERASKTQVEDERFERLKLDRRVAALERPALEKMPEDAIE